MSTELIMFSILVLSVIGIILYDYFQHRKMNKCGYLVILRINNAYVREVLITHGINLCVCAYNPHRGYLMSTEGDLVCGFNEESDHVIADAEKNKTRIIDCGASLKKFIYEIGVLQEIYKEVKS